MSMRLRFKDTCSIRGAFFLRIRKNGEIVEEYRDENMIMNVAKTAMARLIAGDGAGKTITKIGVGTNGIGPTPDDTQLTGAFVKLVAGHTYPQPGHVTFSWSLATTEANGMAIREFGLICSDNTLFARKTRGAIEEKADDISLEGSWTIIF
jgi:hypothetical protein